MSEQENLIQTLNLRGAKNEIFKANINTAIDLKDVDDLPCHEYIGDLLPNEVSSAEESSDDSSYEDDDSENENSDSDSYKTPSLNSSESDLNVSLLEDDPDRETASDSEVSTTLIKKHDIKSKTTSVGTKGDTKLKGRPSSCIFVASLAATLTDDELCHSVTAKFKKFGNLSGVKVLRDTQNRPYAFVQYSNDHDAQRALNLSQGTLLNDRVIRCEQARVNRTLYISCELPIACREVEIFCEKFGELEQLVPSLNSPNKKSDYPKKQLLPNFRLVDPSIYKVASWFAQFAYRDDAIRAFANIKSELDWTVQWVQNVRVPKRYNLLSSVRKSNEEFHAKQAALKEKSEGDEDAKISIDRKSIFIGQLHKDTTNELLTEHFRSYGTIFNVKLFHKPNTIFAFIEYDEESSAAAALEKENHSTFLGKTIHVQYKEINNQARYVRRDARLVYRDSNYSSSYNHNFYVSPQMTLAPPPINISRHKNLGNAATTGKSGVYVDSIAKKYANYKCTSVSNHDTPLTSKWAPTKAPTFEKPIEHSELSLKKKSVANENSIPDKSDEFESDNSSDESSSDTLQSECDTVDLIEGQTQSSSTSYNGSFRSNSKFSKSNNYLRGKYEATNGNATYKPRRYSHPPNPYYQPNYFIGYPGSPPNNNQSVMMYYPPLPMPPPEALNQMSYYQHNHQGPLTYGPNMIPMIIPHGHIPQPTQPPPPPQNMLPPLSPIGFPTSLHVNNSRQNSSSFPIQYSKPNSHHVSFEDDERPASAGNLADSDNGNKNNRFQNLLRNKIPSFTPNTMVGSESDSYIKKQSPEYLDY